MSVRIPGLTLLLTLGACLGLFGQNTIHVTIEIAPEITLKNLYVTYYNGSSSHDVNVTDSKVSFQDTLFSKYASVEIWYQGTSDSKNRAHEIFFVSEKPAVLVVAYDVNLQRLQVRSVNVINYSTMGGTQLDAWCRSEAADYETFLKSNALKLSVDSINEVFWQLKAKLQRKQIEFMKTNPASYAAYWLFSKDLVFSVLQSPDTLLSLYNGFPENLKNTGSGAKIRAVLLGRMLRVGSKAPSFHAKTIDGRLISLDSYKGKYLLLDFWATWCGPCVEEMPIIKQIKEQISNRLEIVAISRDDDSTRYTNAIKNLKIDWAAHVFGNKQLLEAFGVAAIPEIYLIDDSGVILYIRNKDLDSNGMPKLLAIVDKIGVEK